MKEQLFKKGKEDTIQSLLRTLSEEQVEALIHEERLRQMGYRFIYCIDSDELNNYAFPLGVLGERPQQRNLGYEYITDEQVALYSLFNKQAFQAYVLDDHFEEISKLVHKVRYLHTEGGKTVNTPASMLSRLESLIDSQNINNLKNEMEKIREHISLIISIAVGLQADGVEKLHELQKSKKIIFDENELQEHVEELGCRNGYSQLADHLAELVYNFLREKDKKNSKDQFSQESNFSLVKKDIAHLRDSKAIGKVMDLNLNLYQAKSKTIILYISSDYKTQNIFYKKNEYFQDIYQLVKQQSIKIKDSLVNCHRNTAQIFLRLLCGGQDPDLVIQNLSRIKEIIANKELRERTIDDNGLMRHSEMVDIDNSLTESIDKYRKEFEDYSTFIRIDEFKGLSNKLKDKKTTLNANGKEIIYILEEILRQKEKKILEWRYSVDLRLQELSQLTVFRNSITFSLDKLIQEQLEKGNFPELAPGMDYVFNAAHHLPTYFPVKHENSRPLFQEIIAHFKDPKDELSNFTLNFATRLFATKGNIEERSNLDELILKRCILLLLLSNSRYYGDRILEHIESLIKKYEYGGSHLASHFNYVLVWVLRRNQRYQEALKCTLEALEQFPGDPRFHHSLCLVQYCIFEEEKDKSIHLLKESLINCAKAIDGYSEMMEGETVGNCRIIKQNINALLNGRAFLICLGLDFDKNNAVFTASLLPEAREYLMQLKKDTGDQYRMAATHLHTEALLCFMEYKFSDDLNRLAEGIQAIDEAIRISSDVKLTEMCMDLHGKMIDARGTYELAPEL